MKNPLNQDEPIQIESPQNLLKEIESLVQITSRSDNDGQRIQMLVGQLNEKITVSEQKYKNRIKTMKAVQDTSFADLLFDRNEEMNKLRSEIEELKSQLKETSKPKYAEAIEAIKDEASTLRKMVEQRDKEINDLTFKLVDAKAQISFLEKENCSDKPADMCVETVKDHFKIIKEALQFTQTMRQMIQSKKYSSDSSLKTKVLE